MGKYIERCLAYCDERDKSGWNPEQVTYFKTCIEFLQHERMIHLFVMLMSIFVFMFFVVLNIMFDAAILQCGGLIMTALLFCYIHYYKFLENKTQYLYERYEVAWKSVFEK